MQVSFHENKVSRPLRICYLHNKTTEEQVLNGKFSYA